MKPILNQKRAFTLAEVLITLGIIGVVAAMTIPVLLTNIKNKRTYNHLLKVRTTFEQGIKLMLAEDTTSNVSGTEFFINNSYAANEKYLPRYFKVKSFNKTYGFGGSGYTSEKIKQDTTGNKLYYRNLNSKDNNYSYYLSSQLMTGETFVFYLFNNVLKGFYGSIIDKNKNVPPLVGSIMVDLNGTAFPNTIGEDIFCFYIADDGHLVPQGSLEYALINTASGDIEEAKASTYYWKSATKTSNNGCNRDSRKYTGTGRGCTGRVFEEKGIKY